MRAAVLDIIIAKRTSLQTYIQLLGCVFKKYVCAKVNLFLYIFREDWHKIEATRAKQVFFARKFEPIIHSGILNKIDDWLGLTTWPNQTKYWQSVYTRQYDEGKQSQGIVLFLISFI